MSFDTSAPVGIYKNFFNSYMGRMNDIVDILSANFNFNKIPDSIGYTDFWDDLISPAILKNRSFDSEFDNIASITQIASNAIGSRYMDYIGMVQSLDQYLCYAADAFSRIVDCTWAFGDGSIYESRTGKLLPDGTYEIIKESISLYMNNIGNILTEFEDYITADPGFSAPADAFGISRTKVTDSEYLEWKKVNYFIPKVKELSGYIDEVQAQCTKLLYLAEILRDAVTIWFPETFKLVAYTSLAFNLNKKTESLATKMMNFGKGVTTTSLIAADSAAFWRKEVLPDGSNRSQCLIQAILTACSILVYPGQLSGFIDLTWEEMIPQYGK